MYAPDARRMNSGEAPTDLNARTGESTPPGSTAWARANRREDRIVFIAERQWILMVARSPIA